MINDHMIRPADRILFDPSTETFNKLYLNSSETQTDLTTDLLKVLFTSLICSNTQINTP